ncbi:MAG TPA: NADH-quinone oxidoreductase subunit L, partial [Geothrix sp.]
MILVVTGVGFLIHVYSLGYMAHDERFPRFFTYLNLFVGSMLVLVLGNNFLLLYAGWELVGLCSYLLIGFWYNRKSASDAGKKAFLVNRVGDFGFALGIMLIFKVFHSLDFTTVFALAVTPDHAGVALGTITAICLLLLVGACGKSAQFPLHVWLPDAMEGPTPVSALIHAATMVTAGVYMIARCHPLYDLSATAGAVVAIIGIATALLAATMACVQYDIKRVLAYSTISQLGYMFVAVGVGAYAAGIFHLMTHAFFKALLFLGAGSVMHALSNEVDMRRMGGIAKKVPITYLTFVTGTLAIIGFPGLAGFFSKDEILASALAKGGALGTSLYALGLVTAGMTSFYMFRLLYRTFLGKSHVTPEVENHIHESPAVMTVPLMLLAVLSILGGWVGIPGRNLLAEFLSPTLAPHEAVGPLPVWVQMAIAVAVAALGWFVAHAFYFQDQTLARSRRAAEGLAPVVIAARHRWYLDEIYHTVFVRGGQAVAGFLAGIFDVYVIDGIVNGVSIAVAVLGEGWRYFTTGFVRFYAWAVLLGAGAALLIMIWR